jgi:hypothetical protein
MSAYGSRCCTADTRGALPSSPAKPCRQQQQQQQQGLRVGKRQQMLHCRYQRSVTQQSCKALQAAAAAAAAGITYWQEAADAALQIPGECYPAVLHSPAGSSSSSKDYVLASGSRCCTADTRGALPSSPAKPCRQQQQQQQQQGLRVGKRQQMLHCRYQGSVTQQSCTALQAAAAAEHGSSIWQ